MGEDRSGRLHAAPWLLLAAAGPLLWLPVTAFIGVRSGWYELMRGYPDRPEPGLLDLRRCSGVMGGGVALRRSLTLSACPTGLRVEIAPMLGPFSRPFFVPWSDISAIRSTSGARAEVKLTFGQPAMGRLTVSRKTWRRLSAHLSPA